MPPRSREGLNRQRQEQLEEVNKMAANTLVSVKQARATTVKHRVGMITTALHVGQDIGVVQLSRLRALSARKWDIMQESVMLR